MAENTCPIYDFESKGTSAADPRYITHDVDNDRGDVIIPMSEVKKRISLKEQLDEAVATFWLTTAEMEISLTDEPHKVIRYRHPGREESTNDETMMMNGFYSQNGRTSELE